MDIFLPVIAANTIVFLLSALGLLFSFRFLSWKLGTKSRGFPAIVVGLSYCLGQFLIQRPRFGQGGDASTVVFSASLIGVLLFGLSPFVSDVIRSLFRRHIGARLTFFLGALVVYLLPQLAVFFLLRPFFGHEDLGRVALTWIRYGHWSVVIPLIVLFSAPMKMPFLPAMLNWLFYCAALPPFLFLSAYASMSQVASALMASSLPLVILSTFRLAGDTDYVRWIGSFIFFVGFLQTLSARFYAFAPESGTVLMVAAPVVVVLGSAWGPGGENRASPRVTRALWGTITLANLSLLSLALFLAWRARPTPSYY